MSNMSIRFALNVLRSAKISRDNNLAPDHTMCYYDKARNLAIVALKRMDPLKIVIKNRGIVHCPSCEYDIHGIGRVQCCPHCGQALDWDCRHNTDIINIGGDPDVEA